MILMEGLLYRMQFTVTRHAFDGGYFASVGLDGEHRARLHTQPVEMDGAATAVRRVTSDQRANLA
jgi:hypothetical protein